MSTGPASILETEFGASGARQYAGILEAVAHGLTAATAPLPSVMTVAQVAKDMQTSDSTVRRMIEAGEIPTIETHVDFLRIPRAGYLAFLESSKVEIGTSFTDDEGAPVCALDADLVAMAPDGYANANFQRTNPASAGND